MGGLLIGWLEEFEINQYFEVDIDFEVSISVLIQQIQCLHLFVFSSFSYFCS